MRNKISKLLIMILLIPCAIFINACSCGKSKIEGFKIYINEKSYTSEDTPELNINYGTILNLDEILEVKVVYENKTEKQITEGYVVEDESKVTTQIVDVGNYKVKISYDKFESIEIIVNVLKNNSDITNISDISKTYDGKPVNEPIFDKIGDGEITIRYYQGETFLENAPTNAGSYILEIEIGETKAYNSVKVRKDFVINKADLENVELPQIDTINIGYNKNLTLKDIALPNNFRWKDLTITPTTDVNKYVALYNNKDVNNYNDKEVEVTINVSKANRSINIKNDISTVYSEVLKDVEYEVLEDDDIINNVIIEYKPYEASDEEYTKTPVTEIGKYVVRVTIPEETNYNEAVAEKIFYIDKKELEIPKIARTYTYNGQKQKAELIGYNEKIMTIENNERTEAGSQKIKITLIDLNHYFWKDNSKETIIVNFMIQRAKGVEPTTKHKVINGIYDKNKTLNNYILEEGYRWIDKDIIPTCDRNIYPARYNKDVTNYEDIDLDIVVNLSQKEIEIPKNESVYIYDGTEQEAILKGFNEELMTIENNKRTLVGSQQIIIKLKDSINYKWSDNVEYVEIPFEIVTMIYEVENVTVDYDGNEHNIKISGLNQNDIVTYSLDRINYVENLHISQVGEYEIYFKVEGETISYGKATLTINKISLENAVVTLSSTEYEYTSNFVNPEIVKIAIGEIIISKENYVVEYKNNINEGEATIIIKGINNAYGIATKTFNIKKVIDYITFSSDAVRYINLYEGDNFEYNEVVLVYYKNVSKYVTILDYELKLEDGSDLKFESNKSYKVYAYYKGGRSNNYIAVNCTKKDIDYVDLKINEFKTMYNLNEELDSFEKIKINVTFNNGEEKIFTYSEEEKENCFTVEHNFNNSKYGTYRINIMIYNYKNRLSFNVSVNGEYSVTSIQVRQAKKYDQGTELQDIQLDIYLIYNDNSNVKEYYTTISMDSPNVEFVNEYDKNSMEYQKYSVTMEINGQELSATDYLQLREIYANNIKIVKDDITIISRKNIVMPLGFNFDNILVYVVLSNKSEILLNSDDYILDIKNYNNVDEGVVNRFTLTYNNKSYLFYSINEVKNLNAKIKKVTINGEDYTFNDNNELNIESPLITVDYVILIEKEKQLANITAINVLKNGEIYYNYDFIKENSELYIAYIDVLSNYQIFISVEDGKESNVYTINLSFEKVVKNILLNGKEIINNYEKVTLYIGDVVEIILINNNFTTYINDIKTNKYIVEGVNSIYIIIENNEDEKVLEIDLTNVKKYSDFEYVKINNEELEFKYQYENIDYNVKNTNEDYVVEYKLKNNQQKIYYVLYNEENCIKSFTELNETIFTIPNNTTEIIFYTIETNDESYAKILRITINAIEYIDSFKMIEINDNYCDLSYEKYFNKYVITYYSEFICMKEFNVVFLPEFNNYNYEILSKDGTIFDYTNLKNTNELLIIIYDEEGNEVCKNDLILNIILYTQIVYEIDGVDSIYETIFEDYIKIKSNRILKDVNNSDLKLQIYKDNVLVDKISYTEDISSYKFIFTKLVEDKTYRYEVELPVVFTNNLYEYISFIHIDKWNCHSYIEGYEGLVTIYNNEITDEELLEKLIVSLADENNTYKSYIEKEKLIIEIYNSDNTLIYTAKFNIIRKINKDYNSKLIKTTYYESGKTKILNFGTDNKAVIDKIVTKSSICMEFDLSVAQYRVLLNGEVVKSNSDVVEIYININKIGTYEIELTMFSNEIIKYTIVVNNIEDMIMSLNVNGITFNKRIYDINDEDDIKFIVDSEFSAILYACYGELSSDISKVNCMFKSLYFNDLYDNNGNQIKDLLNFELDVLEKFDLRYSVLTIKERNSEIQIYIFYQEEYYDAIITLNNIDFKLKVSKNNSGDFSFNINDIGEIVVVGFHLSITKEDLGMQENENLKILVKSYFNFTILDNQGEILASPTVRQTEAKDIQIEENILILEIKSAILQEIDNFYIIIEING